MYVMSTYDPYRKLHCTVRGVLSKSSRTVPTGMLTQCATGESSVRARSLQSLESVDERNRTP